MNGLKNSHMGTRDRSYDTGLMSAAPTKGVLYFKFRSTSREANCRLEEDYSFKPRREVESARSTESVMRYDEENACFEVPRRKGHVTSAGVPSGLGGP